jgi:hypothetical protein
VVARELDTNNEYPGIVVRRTLVYGCCVTVYKNCDYLHKNCSSD